MGGHLLKRRAETGLTQKEVAAQFGINPWTYLLWEADRTNPTVRYWPAVLRFLGYDPLPEPKSLPERLAAKRRQLGLTIVEAANLIGVDEGTFGRWERGDWEARNSLVIVRRFLSLADRDKGPPADNDI